jgi:hypothetical protein
MSECFSGGIKLPWQGVVKILTERWYKLYSVLITSHFTSFTLRVTTTPSSTNFVDTPPCCTHNATRNTHVCVSKSWRQKVDIFCPKIGVASGVCSHNGNSGLSLNTNFTSSFSTNVNTNGYRLIDCVSSGLRSYVVLQVTTNISDVSTPS